MGPALGTVRLLRARGFAVSSSGHVPVLRDSVVKTLVSAGGRDGTYVDCTFGRGGHTKALCAELSEHGRVVAFDVDPDAAVVAQRLSLSEPRLRFIQAPFASLGKWLPDVKLSGVLADLGVSSAQIDGRGRGFSALADGPLDLRMNPTVGVSAADWLRSVSSEELAWVLRSYGEDRDPVVAARIAEALVARARDEGSPLQRTRQLTDVVSAVKATLAVNHYQHPSRLSLQAIRTHLNQEFQQLEGMLAAALPRLSVGARCVVLCFKPMEVSAVRFFRRRNELPKDAVVRTWRREKVLQLYPLASRRQDWCVTEDRTILPGAEEVRMNTRSRAAQGIVLVRRERGKTS